MTANTAIQRHHHLTLCMGDAQEDYDFHTQVLGMKSVKKTALYDGTVPIYHLYYANDMGDESTIITASRCASPAGWAAGARPDQGHLPVGARGASATGAPASEAGIEARGRALRGEDAPVRESWRHRVRAGRRRRRRAHAARGSRADRARRPRHPRRDRVGARFRDVDGVHAGRLERARRAEDGHSATRSAKGAPAGSSTSSRPDLAPGTWTFGEGTVHHVAFQVDASTCRTTSRRTSRASATPTCPTARTGATSTRSTCARRAARCSRRRSRSRRASRSTSPTTQLGREFQVPPVFAEQAEWIKGYLEPVAVLTGPGARTPTWPRGCSASGADTADTVAVVLHGGTRTPTSCGSTWSTASRRCPSPSWSRRRPEPAGTPAGSWIRWRPTNHGCHGPSSASARSSPRRWRAGCRSPGLPSSGSPRAPAPSWSTPRVTRRATAPSSG